MPSSSFATLLPPQACRRRITSWRTGNCIDFPPTASHRIQQGTTRCILMAFLPVVMGVGDRAYINLGVQRERQDLSPEERKAHGEKVRRMKEQRQQDEQARHKKAAEQAAAIWSRAKPAENHPYLARKGIEAHGARLHNGALIIPMRAENKLYSLQFIGANGEKRFQTGGRVTGCYFSIGDTKDTKALCIAEGFATGATIYQTTGHPVAVAFNAGNLKTVAKTIRQKFLEMTVAICGDNDQFTDGNPGKAKAMEAARAVGGIVVIPKFTDLSSQPTDFNDLHCLAGLDEVARQITEGIEHPPIENNSAVVVSLDSIEPEPVEWLWPDRIALGKITMIAGDPGLGKSMISLAMAATVTVGGRWPVDRAECPKGNVLLLSAEDALADTIRPRLDAAGADPSKVFALTFAKTIDPGTGQERLRSITLENDLAIIEQQIKRIGNVRLLVMDPISAYMGGIDSHRNTNVRALMAPLGDMADRQNVAVLCITHLNKGQGGNAIYRVTGSMAFVAAARASFLVVKDPIMKNAV